MLPTIIIAYLDVSYSDADVKFLYYNEKSNDIEIIAAKDDEEIVIDREQIIRVLDKQILKTLKSS